MKKAIVIAACVGIFNATASHAAVTVYTDRATFEAAAKSGGKNIQTETFDSADVGDFNPNGTAYSKSFDGFGVSGDNHGNYVGVATGSTSDAGSNQPIPSSFANGSNKYLQWANMYEAAGKLNDANIISLTLNLNKATTAFGFDWFNTDFTDQYTLTLPGVSQPYSAPPFTVALSGTTSGFFGLISDTAFTSATITNNFFGGYISDEGFDNLSTNGAGSSNPVSTVPETSTWFMMILGFGFVGYAIRSAHRKIEKDFTAKVRNLALA